MSIRGEDYKEHTRVIDQELAAWIGLNESIFLEQLHFILTKNDSVGKFADGRKWYRDKPHDFVVKYFMFWDESIVKRTINNLRNDGLLLARSDLNRNPKDRSLWYTINYDAINRLSGPVERMAQKLEVRKKARRVRTEKEQSVNRSDYTKVQDELLNNDKGKEVKVQDVPSDMKGTNCNQSSVQNVPDTSVQNVPTPKESYPKDLPPKEIPPNGDGKRPSSSKRVRKPRSFREDSPKAILSRQMFSALANLVKYDLDMLGEKERGQLNQAEKSMRDKGYIPADIEQFDEWWYANDWRGKKNQAPTLNDIRKAWKPFQDWRKGQVEKAKAWTSPDPIPPPPPPEYVAVWEKAAPVLRDRLGKDAFEANFRDAQPLQRSNGTFALSVKQGTRDMIEARPKLKTTILAAFQAVKPEIHNLEFEVIKQ